MAAYNQTGFYALGNGTTSANFSVFRSATRGNGAAFGQGMRAEAGGVIVVSQSNLEQDGWSTDGAGGGIVFSYGDNDTQGQPAPTGTYSKQ